MGRVIFGAFRCEMDTGLYYCQQIAACLSSKRFVKALRIGFNFINPDCSIAFCCFVSATSKHLT